ncbi:MAG: radical SAM protein [Candidatus Omnitrophica bacterium]|nr:radical SAM protein [Candidatus Omnitrophota bacterium]
MKFIYGPVTSRRLGKSLGVSLIPHKTCNFDCIYCQLGPTSSLATERKEYVAIASITEELKNWFLYHAQEAKALDYVTISGAGEPTLNVKIEEIIAFIKRATSVPVAVISNAALFAQQDVRRAVAKADLLVPSLDAVDPAIFKAIDQPHDSIDLKGIIAGLIELRKEFAGQIWLEVMLVEGVNDSLEHIRQLKDVVEKINPDKIQLNSPVRTTSQRQLRAVSSSKLIAIKELLGAKAQII